MLLLAAFTCILRAAPGEQPEMFRIGFSSAMLFGVNENDAKASMRAMAAAFARQNDIPADIEPHLYDGVEALAAGLRKNECNYVGLTTEEYAAIRQEISFDHFTAAENNGEHTETYLLLAHRLGGIATLADLEGHSLSVMDGPRMSLAVIWLDLELTKQSLPVTAEFFQRQTDFAKPGKAILSVFFRQADACLVTQRMFQLITELNPQLARDLRVIATSPGYVPCVFAYVSSFPTALRERGMRAFLLMHLKPATQQFLTMFQTARIIEIPKDDYEKSVALVDEHARLCPAASAARRALVRNPRGFAKSSP